MSDSRPAPQYGEYATPEEVAALRGAQVEALLPPTATPTPNPTPTQPAATAPPRAPATGARRYDRPLTIVMLLFGVLNLAQYATALLDFDTFLDRATVGTPAEAVDFGEPARVGGYVLFGVSLLLLLVAGYVSVQLLRRGRLAFWVPLVAGAVTALTWLVVLIAIVVQTPDALEVPAALGSSLALTARGS